MSKIILIIISIICIILLLLIINKKKSSFDNPDKIVKDFIKHPKKKRNDIDNFIIGNHYAYNKKTENLEPNNTALRFYDESLDNITNGTFNLDMGRIILDRIENVVNVIDNNEIKNNFEHKLDNAETTIHKNKIKKHLKMRSDKRKKKRTQIKQVWKVDRQNVHDTKINSDSVKHFNFIKKENGNISDYNITGIVMAILDKTDIQQREKVSKVLQVISQNAHYSLFNTKESDILKHVWKRIQSPINSKNKKELINSLIDTLHTSVEHGSVVCQTGRVNRLMNTFAFLDANDKIGVFKSKQAIRNEILNESSKIVDNILKNISKDKVDKYNNGDDVPEIIQKITKKIEQLSKDYSDDIKSYKLQNIITEIKESIL